MAFRVHRLAITPEHYRNRRNINHDHYRNTTPSPQATLRPASQEQLNIIAAIRAGHNVIVDAVAGSGKTTVVLHVARDLALPTTMITYNRTLADETRARATALRIHNLRVFTIHQLAGYLFGHIIKDDTEMAAAINMGGMNLSTLIGSVFVIDEMQDLCALYAKLISTVLATCKAAGRHPQLLCMGDWQQAVYEYKDECDCRYLTRADEIFGLERVVRLPLHTSYRLTHEMSAFLNTCTMTGRPDIHTVKSGPPVIIISATDHAKSADSVMRILKRLRFLKNGSGTRLIPDDEIMICARSCTATKRSPLDLLQKALTYAKFPLHISSDDYDTKSAASLADKISFSTICKSKGRERKVVVVYDFDDPFARKTTPMLSKPDYVSLTRASALLIVVRHGEWAPCFRADVFEANSIVLSADEAADRVARQISNSTASAVPQKILHICEYSPRTRRQTVRQISASKMGQHLNTQLADQLAEELRTMVPNCMINEINTTFALPTESQFHYLYRQITEEHANINALVISMLLEMRIRNIRLCETSIGKSCREHCERAAQRAKTTQSRSQFQRLWPAALIAEWDIAMRPFTVQLLQIAVQVAILYESICSEYTHRLAQFTRYSFLNDHIGTINTLCDAYAAYLPTGLVFERPISTEVSVRCGAQRTKRTVRIHGRIDAYCEDIEGIHVYEFKYNTGLKLDHRLQCVNYGVMLDNNRVAFARLQGQQPSADWPPIRCHLINLRDGCEEQYYLPSSKATAIFNEQLKYKLRDEPDKPTDADFLAAFITYNNRPTIEPRDAEQCDEQCNEQCDAQEIADDLLSFCGHPYVKKPAAHHNHDAHLNDHDDSIDHLSEDFSEYLIVSEPNKSTDAAPAVIVTPPNSPQSARTKHLAHAKPPEPKYKKLTAEHHKHCVIQ